MTEDSGNVSFKDAGAQYSPRTRGVTLKNGEGEWSQVGRTQVINDDGRIRDEEQHPELGHIGKEKT